MMLSMFHHHQHNQPTTDQEQSSPENHTDRPLSSDHISTSTNASGESSINHPDFDHHSEMIGGHNAQGPSNISPLAPNSIDDPELEPEDLSVHGRRESQEDSKNMACNVAREASAITDVMPYFGNESARLSNGAIDSESSAISGNQRSNHALHCPLCNFVVADEAEFFHHLLLHNSTENGAEAINAVFSAADSRFPKNTAAVVGGDSAMDDEIRKRTNAEAFCELCNKEFCNIWFLKTHKAKVHGITSDDFINQISIHQPIASGSQYSDEQQQTPKTSPDSSVFDSASAMANPLSALPFSALDQHQLAALGQQNVCPFCHQFFPNLIILQSHLLTAHPGMVMNPAAAFYAASVMGNPFAVNGAAFLQQQSQSNGKNLQQQQQMAAIAAMLGFGAGPSSMDPMAAASVGGPLDYFTQGMSQTPSLQGSNFGSTGTPMAMKNSKFTGQYQGILAGFEEEKPNLPVQQMSSKTLEAYCEICQKEFCNKYFLRTHKMNKHGILDESPKSNGSNRLNAGNKSPGANSPSHRFPHYNGNDAQSAKRESFVDLLRGGVMDEDGPPAPKMAKLSDSGLESGPSGISTSTGQFSCNLCVKNFPSMFALVAHKYRDHGTFDGASASALIGQNPQVFSSSSPNLGFASESRKSFDTDLTSLASQNKSVQQAQSVDLEAYCEICQKEFCSKYFLKVHKANIHGIGSDPNSSPSMVTTNGSGIHVPVGVRRSLNGSLSNGNGSPTLTTTSADSGFKSDYENGRRNSGNGTPSSAAAILMMAANGGMSSNVGRPLVASKNFCDICNKELCNKYFLRTHMLKMHGIVIDENKTVIANINTLDKEKTGELLFRCDLCGEQLATRQQLRAHKQSVHQIAITTPVAHSTSSVTASNENSNSGAVHDSQCTSNSTKRESIEDIIDNLAADRNGRKSEHEHDIATTPTTTRVLNEPREVLCLVCGKKYKNAGCLRTHMLNEHSPMGQKSTKKTGPTCEYCSMEFPDHAELQLHVINEHQREVRGSVACMAEQAALDALTNTSAFVAAVNSVANAVAEAASANGTNTPATGALFEAVENETETKAIIAPEQQHTELPLVTRAKNGTKLFRCSYCNYYTRWISNLSTHEKRHNVGKPLDAESGEKPFKCRMCLRSYRYSHSLQRHMEGHRSSAIGLRAAGNRAPIPLAAPGQQPSLSHNGNDTRSTTPPALTPGPNGQDHAISGAFEFSADISAPTQGACDHATPLENGSADPKPVTAVTPSPDKRHHCQLCGKAFGNRELYRMHVLTIHDVALPPDSSPSKINGASPKRHRCRLCHFVAAKSYDELRMHMFQKHSATAAYLKVLSNGVGQNSESEQPSQNSLDLTLKSERASLQNGITTTTTTPRCEIQAFFMQEASATGIFPTSGVVYLPVLHRVDSPIEVTFTLTPVGDDHVSMGNGSNGHA